MTVTFQVLGPLRISRDGRDIRVSAAKQRVLLAALLLDAGRVVSVQRLIDVVWGDAPIRSARQTLHAYLTRLREILGAGVIVTADQGYRLNAGPEELDLVRFDRLVDEAGELDRAGDAAAAAHRLTTALGLWRGEVLANVPSEWLHRRDVPILAERRLAALEWRLALDIRLGRAGAVVEELRELTSRHPLRERTWALLMRALHATGRQAEAEATYRRVSTLLADELGIDPGTELRQLRGAILADESDRQGVATRPDLVPTPQQLPAAPAGFVGRAALLELLRSRFEVPDDRSKVLLTGPPGVGKSALAVTVGHLLHDAFPDGQLFVDLRGFSPGQALQASDVLPRFLRGLGMAPVQIPVDVDEQAAAYRSLLADRRVLVVLDNAATVEQVRPLLPGEPGCGVIITSRNQLRALAAIDGVHLQPLDVLTTEEATALLAGQLGSDRLAAEPMAAERLATACAHLPLALRVAGANLASQPLDAVSEYVSELQAGEPATDLWAEGDRSSITVGFDLSYAALDPAVRRLFRLLGLIPGPDFTTATAAALAERDVRRDLDALVGASLVQPYAPGRFRMHDLIRGYAHRRAHGDDGAEACETARRRLFDWYVGMVDAGLAERGAILTLVPRAAPDEKMRSTASVEWIDAELPNLLATVTFAADHGPAELTWRLADALRRYFSLTDRHSEGTVVADTARQVAEREGDDDALAAMHYLACDSAWRRAPERAVAHGRLAVELYQRIGKKAGEAAAWYSLAGALDAAYQGAEAIESVARAVAIFRIEDPPMARRAAVGLANLWTRAGRLTEATTALERVLDHAESDGAVIEAQASQNLGWVLRQRGQLVGAIACLERARLLELELGDRYRHVQTHIELARCHNDGGAYPLARAAVAEAQVVTKTLGTSVHHLHALVTLAEADVREGSPEGWADRLPAIVDAVNGPSSVDLACEGLDVLALAHRRSGDLASALRADDRALRLAGSHGLRVQYDAALTSRTATMVGLGRFDEAVEHGVEALRRHRETGHRLHEARTLCHLGDAYRGRGDDAAARRHWELARDRYADVGTAEISAATRRLDS